MTVALDPHEAATHRGRLHRAAVRLTGNPHDADDLVQDTYEAVLRRPRRLGDRANVSAYLMTALEHRHVDWHREHMRRGPRVDVGELPELAGPHGTRPQQRAEHAEVITTVLRLPAHHRDVVLAVDVAGLSYAEAATALGIPLGTVMSRLYRARASVARSFTAPGARRSGPKVRV